jgi:hypothetical protein
MAKLLRHDPGHPVVFTNPETGQPEYGEILDEVWAREPEEFEGEAPSDGGWRQAAFVAQLIKWQNGYRSVRITYYLRPEGGGPGTWYFGGQYSPSMSLDEFRSLMTKLQTKGW